MTDSESVLRATITELSGDVAELTRARLNLETENARLRKQLNAALDMAATYEKMLDVYIDHCRADRPIVISAGDVVRLGMADVGS